MINLSILLEVKNYALFDYIKQYVICLKRSTDMSTVSNTIQGYFSCFSKQLNCFYVLSTKRIFFRTYSIELPFIVFWTKSRGIPNATTF